jgi:hypothetical protein
MSDHTNNKKTGTMTDKMPKMFIGSSSESSNYLTKIEKQLKDVVEFNAWNKQVFNQHLEII